MTPDAKIARAAAVVAARTPKTKRNHDSFDNTDKPRDLRRSHMNVGPGLDRGASPRVDDEESFGHEPCFVNPYQGPWRW